MDFVAFDVETANSDMGSICQIGAARFVSGQIVEEWSTLVDPEDHFDYVNISIHGIDSLSVEGQPKLPRIAERLRTMLEGGVSVCHTHFDRVAIAQAFLKYQLDPIATSWLDSARVARRMWKEFAWKGYGLANVCARIGYDFKHHDALEDAKAAGYVLLAAIRESQQGLEAWRRRVNQPIDLGTSSSSAAIRRDGNPEGDLYGEVLVFTGALEMRRVEAADLAAHIGCQVASGVTKKTTILVIGDQDGKKFSDQKKSRKHLLAEQLVAEGHRLRVIREADFKSLIQNSIDRIDPSH